MGRLAAAVATTTSVAVVGVGGAEATTAVVIDQQQHDDDQQDPVAIAPAKQITQTHSFHPLTIPVYVKTGKGCGKFFGMTKRTKNRLYSL